MPLFIWVLRIVVLFAILTAIYLALSFYNRWAERRRLQAAFQNEEQGEAVAAVDQESFVEQGMHDYERSLRKKLLLGVYLIPLGVAALLIGVALYG